MPESPVSNLPPREPIQLAYASRQPLRKRIGSDLQSWARDTFSRESLLSSLKALAWVGPLTVLIWIYAVREQGASKGTNFAIEVRGDDPSRVVKLTMPLDGRIHAELKGPQSGVDAVENWLETSGPVPIEIDHNLLPGVEHPIPLDQRLNELWQLKSNGVTIANVMPPECHVYVDPIVTIEAEVQARPDELQKLAGPPVFTPAKIKLRGPQSIVTPAQRQAQARNESLVVFAKLSAFRQFTQPGKQQIASVAVTPSVVLDDPSVRLTPTTVSAEFDVKSGEAEAILPYVRVMPTYPDVPDADRYKPVFNPLLNLIHVIGPQDEIELLKQQKIRPSAIFEVVFPRNSEEINGTFESPVHYIDLPPGVRVDPKDLDRKISYKFKQRTPGDQ